jgi:hypothetical protein
MKEVDREEDGRRRRTMIVPGSVGDWALLAGMLGSLSALAVCGHRWVLRETVMPERIRSHPLAAARTSPNHVPT